MAQRPATRAAIASPTCVVLAVPPRSGVAGWWVRAFYPQANGLRNRRQQGFSTSCASGIIPETRGWLGDYGGCISAASSISRLSLDEIASWPR